MSLIDGWVKCACICRPVRQDTLQITVGTFHDKIYLIIFSSTEFCNYLNIEIVNENWDYKTW